MTSRSRHRHPHPSAQAHGSHRRSVGLVWEWEDDIDQSIGVMRYANKAHWILRRHIFVRRIKHDGTIAHVLSSAAPDGIITQLSHYEPELQTVRALAARGVPVVELSQVVPDFKVPRVLPDRYAEGVLAAQHFLERGVRILVYIGDPQRLYRDGFVDEAAKDGVSVIVPRLPTASSTPRRRAASASTTANPAESYGSSIEELLSAHRPPLGVFVPFAEQCEEVLDDCLERNLLVPAQIALISTGGTHSNIEYLPVPITIVVSDFDTQSFTAAAVLDRMMAGDRDVPAVTLIPPRGIIARASTRISGVADPGVAGAWNYILTHVYDPNLSLKGVARAAGIPMWRLYEEFPKYAGMTVARYIQHQRILHARHLLDTTILTASEIAAQCGFSEPRQFRDALRRTIGATPAAYRAHHRGTSMRLQGARPLATRQESSVTAARTDSTAPPLTQPVELLVRLLKAKPLGNAEIRVRLGLKDRTHLREHYLDPALAKGLIERTIPHKPNSRLQQYRLTKKGLRQLSSRSRNRSSLP